MEVMFPLGLARAEFSSMGKPQGTGTIQSYVPVVRKAGVLVVTEDTRPQNYPGTQCCLYRSQKHSPTSWSPTLKGMFQMRAVEARSHRGNPCP